MNLEKFLSYVTHQSESIIQWLFLAILLLAGTLIAHSLFGKRPEPESEPEASADLHSALEKILAQTTKLESVSLEKLSTAGVAEVDAQVQALKADLAAREVELTQLKTTSGTKNSEEATALSGRIKELEAKLSEYEILEDDIADLSLYKEENARLKTELDSLKGGAPATASVEAVAAVEASPTGDDIVAEFTQAVEQGPAAEAAPASVSEVAPPAIEISDTGNIMADFESTVQLEKQLATETAGPEPVAVAPLAPAAPPQATAPEVSAPVASQQEADDLFAEFSSAAPEEGGAALDTDKMMAEMAALVSIEPASGSSLEESIDTDKMAAEASTLPKS